MFQNGEANTVHSAGKVKWLSLFIPSCWCGWREVDGEGMSESRQVILFPSSRPDMKTATWTQGTEAH